VKQSNSKLVFNAIWSIILGGIIGGGIFSNLGLVLDLAGTGAWLSFVVTGLVTLAAGYSYVKLVAHYNEGDGAFTYLRKINAKGVARFAQQKQYCASDSLHYKSTSRVTYTGLARVRYPSFSSANPMNVPMKIRHSIAKLLLICSSLIIASNSLAGDNTPVEQQLAAGSALLVDLETNEVLYSSNADVVVPIASVTKLMTAMVVLDAKLPLDQQLPITIRDTKEMKGVFSRVRVGSEISRRTMLLLALMSSENRAAASLAHHYPGGHVAFIAAMNAKAKALGMRHTHYVEPTGLSEHNVSTAYDLVLLLKASQQYRLLGQLSATTKKTVRFRKPNYTLDFNNTNALVRKANWSVQLTKTGYTDEAGHCLVMRTVMNKRSVAFVVLDAFGKYTHIADASRLRNWLETGKVSPVPAAAINYRQQKIQQRHLQVAQ